MVSHKSSQTLGQVTCVFRIKAVKAPKVTIGKGGSEAEVEFSSKDKATVKFEHSVESSTCQVNSQNCIVTFKKAAPAEWSSLPPIPEPPKKASAPNIKQQTPSQTPAASNPESATAQEADAAAPKAFSSLLPGTSPGMRVEIPAEAAQIIANLESARGKGGESKLEAGGEVEGGGEIDGAASKKKKKRKKKKAGVGGQGAEDEDEDEEGGAVSPQGHAAAGGTAAGGGGGGGGGGAAALAEAKQELKRADAKSDEAAARRQAATVRLEQVSSKILALEEKMRLIAEEITLASAEREGAVREAAAAEIQFEIAENGWLNAVERVSKIEEGASEVTSGGKEEGGGGGKGEGLVPVEVKEGQGVVGDGKKKKKNRKKKKKKKTAGTDKDDDDHDDDNDDDDDDDDDDVNQGDCDVGAKSPTKTQFRRVMIQEVDSSSGSEDADPSPQGRARRSSSSTESSSAAVAAAPAAPAPAPPSTSAATSTSRATLQKGNSGASEPGVDAQVAKALVSELAAPEAPSNAASVSRFSKATSSVGKETGAVGPSSPFKRVDIVVDDDDDDEDDDEVVGDGGAGVRGAASPGDKGFKRVEILEEDSEEDDDDEVKEAQNQQKPPPTSASTSTTTRPATSAAASAPTLPHVQVEADSTLDLSGQYAGDEAVSKRIAELMKGPGTGKVATLQLSGNDLTSAAATYILAEACPKMPWITSLILHDNQIDDECAASVGQLLAHHPLSTLSLSMNDMTASSIQKWNLSAASHLTALDVGNNDLGNAGAHELALALATPGFPLATLDISNIAMGAAGASAIAQSLKTNTRLLRITIDDNDCATCIPSFVECCAHVESLSIRNTGLTDSLAKVTMSRIAVGEMGLKRIDARSNAQCTDVSRIAAKGLSKVKKGLEVQV